MRAQNSRLGRLGQVKNKTFFTFLFYR